MEIVLCSHKERIRDRWREALEPTGWRIVEVSGSEKLLANGAGGGAEVIMLHLPPDGTGRAAAVKSAVAKFARARVMIFSDVPSDDDGLAMLRLGIAGYCNTYMNAQLLRLAVELVRGGEIWAGQSLVRKLVSTVSASLERSTDTAPNANPLEGLTAREAEIAMLVAAGASNKRVAQRLDITERTVKSHMSSLFRKTGARDRLQLALLVNAGRAA